MGVRGVKDSTVSLRSSKIGYDLSRIVENIATVSVRISTIPLRLRYELGHAQLPPRFATVRHECFKQFKTSVALPYSFPNHHDSSRFTTIQHGSTTNDHGTPRYTTILQIVANRSGTVADNRECVNGALQTPYLYRGHSYWNRSDTEYFHFSPRFIPIHPDFF